MKRKKSPAEILDSLHEATRRLGKLSRAPSEGPTWSWEELPGGRAGLFSNEGEVLLICDHMPKPEVARAIAAAPDLSKEKLGILFDRRYFQTDAPKRLARSDDTTSSLLFLDLDNFKPVNDLLGHHVGDEVLRIYFHTVASEVGGIGAAYGWGGDEVAVLLPGRDRSIAETVRDKIVASVTQKCSAHPRLVEEGIVVSVSGGIYVFEESEALEEVIKNADAAMYEEKKMRKTPRATLGVDERGRR